MLYSRINREFSYVCNHITQQYEVYCNGKFLTRKRSLEEIYSLAGTKRPTEFGYPVKFNLFSNITPFQP